MSKIRKVIIFFFYLFSLNMSAQEALTEAQKLEFQNRVRQKIDEFQCSLSNIVNHQLKHEIRKEEVNKLLKLFIGEGDPYDYYDVEADARVHSTGVKIQISNVYKTKSQSQKLKNYIYKLYNPQTRKSTLPYTNIVIESASAIRVDNIEKVDDHYECIAYFRQKFIGYRDDKVWYTDTTSRKIRCRVNHNYIELPTGRKMFDVILGDMWVTKCK